MAIAALCTRFLWLSPGKSLGEGPPPQWFSLGSKKKGEGFVFTPTSGPKGKPHMELPLVSQKKCWGPPMNGKIPRQEGMPESLVLQVGATWVLRQVRGQPS